MAATSQLHWPQLQSTLCQPCRPLHSLTASHCSASTSRGSLANDLAQARLACTGGGSVWRRRHLWFHPLPLSCGPPVGFIPPRLPPPRRTIAACQEDQLIL